MNKPGKPLLLLALGLSVTALLHAQREMQIDTSIYHTRPIIPAPKAELLKNIDVIANMQYNFRNEFQDGVYKDSRFSMDQFRLEIKGKVFDKVYFRFRDRYTRATEPQSVDNISHSVDLAYIRIDANPQWAFSFGKMCADWGGYEFDMNPIDIYQYNDIVEYADNFLSGAQITFQPGKSNEFNLQLTNARTRSFQELYDTIPGITPAKFPSAITANWRGALFDGKFTTIWSYSFFTDAVGQHMNYIALGNQYHINKKWMLTYDFKWDDEGLDRKFIVSGIVPKTINPYAAQKVRYIEHWAKVDFGFAPRWHAAIIGMLSNAYWNGNPDAAGDKHLRSSWGFIPSIEYFPVKQLNLKFFVNYVGRWYNYSDYAKRVFGSANAVTGRINFGFSTPLVIL